MMCNVAFFRLYTPIVVRVAHSVRAVQYSIYKVCSLKRFGDWVM